MQELEKRVSVNQLIGKPIISTPSDEEEISAFRQTMARLRYLERMRKKADPSSSSSDAIQAISRPKGLQDRLISDKIMVLVTLPELKVKKTIQTLGESFSFFSFSFFDVCLKHSNQTKKNGDMNTQRGKQQIDSW